MFYRYNNIKNCSNSRQGCNHRVKKNNYSNDMYYNDYQEDKYVIGAYVSGGPLAPNINGMILFEPDMEGTIVSATFYNLPEYEPASNDQGPIGPFGFHLHEHGSCNIGNIASLFEDAGGHWNPDNQPHGNHAGDFPVVFSNNGYSQQSFFTNKFRPEDVIGKAVIIHQNPDDYRTQPSGNSGKRLACGVIGYISLKG